MAMTFTASSINSAGSPLRAGGDTITKILCYTWDANGTTSGTLTSTSLSAYGMTTVVDAICTASSGTVIQVTTTNNDIKLIPTSVTGITTANFTSSDTGRLTIIGY